MIHPSKDKQPVPHGETGMPEAPGIEATLPPERLDATLTWYHLLFNHVSDAVFVHWGPDKGNRPGRFIEVNDVACQRLGYTREELLKMGPLDIDAPDTVDGVPAMMETLLREKRALWEGVHIRKDGTRIPVEIHNRLFYQDDKPLILSTVRDITERKEAEGELQKNEQFLRLITDNIRDAIRVIDLETLRYTFANPHARQLFGIPEQDYVGSSLGFNLEERGRRHLFGILKDEIEHDAERDPNRFMLIELLETNRLRGERLWTENKASFIRGPDGKPTAILSITRDITERRRTEERLREAEERYKALYERSFDAVYINDFEGRFLDANDTALTLLGYGRDEIASLNFMSLLSEDQWPNAMSAVAEIKTKGVIQTNRQYRLKCKDGSSVWVETTASPLYKDGYPFAILGVARDVTLRKKAEAERQSLEGRLRRAEKMEALGTLAGGVAHDLNNVLGVLVGYSELLLEKMPESILLRDYADKILQSGLRGAAIIQDLLTLARRGVTISEVISLNQIVSDYFKTPEFEKLKAYHPHVTFRIDLETDLLNCKGSPVHLGKTVMNLISNASVAIHDRGEVTVQTRNSYLERPIRGYDEIQEGDYAVLTVKDSGMGIPSKDLGKIFEPFYTKKVMGRSGTGLGLAVVWGTVKDHDGYIDVQSEEGHGSTFTLYFPVTRDEMTGTQTAPLPEVYMGHGESILVVDDVEGQRELARAILKRLGYGVDVVSSGEEALAYLKTRRADLLVLDMIMDPGMDGLETYRRVLEIRPGQKAVIVSGFSETERVHKAQEIGAGAYVRKPYVLEKIGLAIRRELDKTPPSEGHGN